jgi:hypothetical protein
MNETWTGFDNSIPFQGTYTVSDSGIDGPLAVTLNTEGTAVSSTMLMDSLNWVDPQYVCDTPCPHVTTGARTAVLSDEYTDGELRGVILDRMLAYSGGWYSGDYFWYTVAYSVIDADHVDASDWNWPFGQAELQKMLYQFRLPSSERGAEYTVTYDLITYELSTGQVEVEPRSATIIGTGSVAFSDEIEELPPRWDESDWGGFVFTWVDNVTVTKNPSGGFSPPGTGLLHGLSGCSTCASPDSRPDSVWGGARPVSRPAACALPRRCPAWIWLRRRGFRLRAAAPVWS